MPDIEYRTIEPVELLNMANDLKDEGCRLIQICASKKDEEYLELDYSFDNDYKFIDIKIVVKRDAEIASISSVFKPAFLYENEIESLFGIKVRHMAVDFKGNFYITAKKTPFMDEAKDGEVNG